MCARAGVQAGHAAESLVPTPYPPERAQAHILECARAQVYKPATPAHRRAEVMTTREYAGGELRREEVLRVADYDLRRKAAKRDARRRLSDDRRAPAAEARHPANTLPAAHPPAHAGSCTRCQKLRSAHGNPRGLHDYQQVVVACVMLCVPAVAAAIAGSACA